MTGFALIAIVMTLLTAGLVLVPLLRHPDQRSPAAAAVVALLIPAGVLVSYLGASNYRWDAPPAVAAETSAEAATGGEEPAPLSDAIQALEERLRETPDDQDGWVLLGSSYAATGRPEEALPAFRRALELSEGKNVNARLGVAEATLLMDQNAMAGEAGKTIEEVLKVAPDNPKALWYGGMVALIRGEPELARSRWESLLALNPPERIRQIVEGELTRLSGGQRPAGNAGAADAPAAAGSLAIAVSLADGIRAQVKDGAPLFVFVRDGVAQGPPVAVVRRSAGELPLELKISDADVMIPGRSLANLSSAAIVARVSNSGDPLPKPGDLYGEASWQAGQKAGEGADAPIRIVIDQLVK